MVNFHKIAKTPHLFRNIILQFIVGGCIVAGTTFLVQFVDENIAAIVWSFPFSLFPTIYFLWMSNVSLKSMSSYVFATAFGLIVLLCFILAFSFSAKYVKTLQKKKNGPLYCLLIAFIIWAIAAFIMYKLNIASYFNKF